MPEEQRKGYLDLTSDFRAYVAESRQWQQMTDDYRKNLCLKIDSVNIKIDDINRRLYSLPCDKQAEIMISNKGKIGWLWIILCGIIMAIIGAYIRK